MSMTGTNIATRVRAITKDLDAGDYDTEDAEMVLWINDCTQIIHNERPEAFIGSGALVTVTEIAAVANTLPLDVEWRPHYAHYVAGCALMKEGRDKEDKARAKIHFDLFWSMIRPRNQ